jgi:hypothetical protein
VASFFEDEIIVRLSHRQVLTIGAALACYMDYWEQPAAADGYENHSTAQLEDIRQQVGDLIWNLEEAGAPPGARLEHSQRDRHRPGGAALADSLLTPQILSGGRPSAVGPCAPQEDDCQARAEPIPVPGELWRWLSSSLAGPASAGQPP